MTTVCWTVIHHAAAPVRHVAAHLVGHGFHHTAKVAHHAISGAPRPRIWFEIVCKVLPAAVAGGGLLVPQPAGPPLPPQPPALIRPAPAAPLGLPWIGRIPPTIASRPITRPPEAVNVPEPSTAGLLLIGAGGMALIRVAARLRHAQPGNLRPS
jgi:hypothetical protein